VFGAVTWFWQEGHGSDAVFGVSATGAITFWLPVIIFAFLFGLSMDYEVFILARMREEYDATGSTSQAVVTGLGRTGRLVTSAALILFFSFAALASSPGTDIKVIGTALGVGILIDATLVRALLVPALVSLFGRWNWWLPAGVARVLRVEPSPVAAEPGRPTGGGRHRGQGRSGHAQPPGGSGARGDGSDGAGDGHLAGPVPGRPQRHRAPVRPRRQRQPEYRHGDGGRRDHPDHQPTSTELDHESPEQEPGRQ
jgi:putative drug exporter of the RND superfamily